MIDFLTSDLFGIVLIALLIVVSISFAAFLLNTAIHTFRVSRFFARYGSLLWDVVKGNPDSEYTLEQSNDFDHYMRQDIL